MHNVVNNGNADLLHNVLNIETTCTSPLWNICKRKPAIADICGTLNRTVAMCVSQKLLSPCELQKQLWTSVLSEMGTEWFLNFIQKSLNDQCYMIMGPRSAK